MKIYEKTKTTLKIDADLKKFVMLYIKKLKCSLKQPLSCVCIIFQIYRSSYSDCDSHAALAYFFQTFSNYGLVS